MPYRRTALALSLLVLLAGATYLLARGSMPRATPSKEAARVETYVDPPAHNLNVGWHGLQSTKVTYDAEECEGVVTLFREHPIPLGLFDEETGREIVGYRIVCEDTIVEEIGANESKPGDFRRIPRAFGWIEVAYAPLAQ